MDAFVRPGREATVLTVG